MSRIVGGRAGGRRLVVPRGSATRPTAERTREALFSSLESAHGTLAGRAFLDLYAGSGAVGLEAASRGAAPVVLVERDARAVATIRRNADTLGLEVDIRGESVTRFLTDDRDREFDLVFLDPPYGDSVDRPLELLVDGGWLRPGAAVVVERATRGPDLSWPDGLVADRTRRYGDTTLWYGRRP